METIADPKNGKIYSIFSEAGKNILRNYVNKYKLGGNKIEPYKIFCKNTENGPVCSPNPGALIRGPAGLPRRDMSAPSKPLPPPPSRLPPPLPFGDFSTTRPITPSGLYETTQPVPPRGDFVEVFPNM